MYVFVFHPPTTTLTVICSGDMRVINTGGGSRTVNTNDCGNAMFTNGNCDRVRVLSLFFIVSPSLKTISSILL
jgi:hypothetical protein